MDTVRRRYETTRWVGLQNVRVLQARNGPRRRPAAPALLQGRSIPEGPQSFDAALRREERFKACRESQSIFASSRCRM